MALPNFLVIGAAKSGTTAFYHLLRQHPDIYMSPQKEPNYFIQGSGEMYFQGPHYRHLQRYRDLFDPSRIKIILYQDFSKDPVAIMGVVFEFLNVDPSFRCQTHRRYNISGQPRNAAIGSVYRWLRTRSSSKSIIRRALPARPRSYLRDWATDFIQAKFLLKPSLHPHTAAQLTDRYASDVRALEQVLGRDLSQWRTTT